MDNTENYEIRSAVINKAINYIFDHIDEKITVDALDDAGKLITVENFDSFTVIYERKKGNYHELPREWCRFIEKYEHLATEETLYMECTIDDPTITDEDHCMYELCQTVFPEQLVLKKNEHILLQNFQGGKYAAYHFKGFPQFLFMVYQEIFCRWLSRTRNQLDEKRPIFDIYRVVGEDGYMEIDICFPLK